MTPQHTPGRTPVRRVDQGMAGRATEILPESVSQELRTRYRQLRIMVHTAGLAATYAFVAAKGNSETNRDLARAYRDVATGIRRHLTGRGLLPAGGERMGDREVLAELAALDLPAYTRASAEITELTGWLSRLADAVYQPVPEGED
jgi:CRISPR/Cas system CMR-associated protein Cmr5 small subunit